MVTTKPIWTYYALTEKGDRRRRESSRRESKGQRRIGQMQAEKEADEKPFTIWSRRFIRPHSNPKMN
ncbi:MAG: hypothetical protein QME50_06960 [Candidatus Bathyarchaeota archaeon]|nr:hypothetical protein [Candidatus Bathyarchaeota archaeon]